MADVVFTWTCATTGVLPLRETEDGTVHEGRLCGLESDVVTAQVKFTAPVNPFEGVRLIVEVLALVAPAVT